MTTDQRTVGVYFIDQYNCTHLMDSADKGDALSKVVVESMLSFVNQAPKPICAMCREVVPNAKIVNMTVVVMHMETATLTSWICEECSLRDDLDTHIEKTLRAWPAIPQNADIEMINKPKTVH